MIHQNRIVVKNWNARRHRHSTARWRAPASVSITVGRGPVPRHRSRARPCRARSSEALAYLPSDPDPFVIRRAQPTVGKTYIVTLDNAGDRPPRSEKKRFLEPKGPKTPPLDDAQRRGNPLGCAYGIRGPRATGTSRPGGLSYGCASRYETPSTKWLCKSCNAS